MSQKMQYVPEKIPSPFFMEISLALLVPNNYNARRFQENMTPQRQAKFKELVASVREKGIIEPLIVRPQDGDRFEIIAGERRYRAALLAAMDLGIADSDYFVPCVVRKVTDEEAFNLMVIENLQREDLSPVETAKAFKAYLDRHGNTAEAVSEIAGRTGIPAHAIRRQVRLLELPAAVLTAWEEGSISQSHVELFTRVGDSAQVVDLLTLCLRLKLSTRELSERIGSLCPELERGFFDKAACQACAHNTAVQCGLFADSAPDGKCGNPSCFEDKQAEFLTANWQNSKAAELFGTRGFRFGHRLSQEHREPIHTEPVAGRCLQCDQFVSVLRLTGAVVSGYARTCTGPRACFEELYLKAATPSAPEPEKQEKQPAAKQEPAPESAKTDKSAQAAAGKAAAKPATKKAAPPEETGPVFNAFRAEKFRDAFFKQAIRDRIEGADCSSPHSRRLVLFAVMLAVSGARTHMIAGLGLQNSAQAEQLADEIFRIPAGDLDGWLQGAALAQVLDPGVSAGVRRQIGEAIGIDLSREWAVTREYLEALSRSEIVRIGEEPGVDMWTDDKLKDRKQEKYKGKALMSLKKEELVDLVLTSGAELKGRVPAEILGKKG